MNRIKTVLVAVGIFLTVSISSQEIVMGAQVQRIHKNRRFVYVDAGTKDGLTLGSTVCIYSFSGKRIVCGRVYKTSESKAMVGIDKAKVIEIKNGMEARLINETKR